MLVLLLLVITTTTTARLSSEEIEAARTTCNNQCNGAAVGELNTCMRKCWSDYFKNLKPAPLPQTKKRMVYVKRDPLSDHIMGSRRAVGFAHGPSARANAEALAAGVFVLAFAILL